MGTLRSCARGREIARLGACRSRMQLARGISVRRPRACSSSWVRPRITVARCCEKKIGNHERNVHRRLFPLCTWYQYYCGSENYAARMQNILPFVSPAARLCLIAYKTCHTTFPGWRTTDSLAPQFLTIAMLNMHLDQARRPDPRAIDD